MDAAALLVLEYEGLGDAIETFYKRLDSSPAFRESFVASPARAIEATLFKDWGTLTPATVSKSNRFLFALLSNPTFIEWATTWEKGLVDQAKEASEISDPSERLQTLLVTLDRQRLYNDVVTAVLKFGDPEMIRALVIPEGVSGSASTFATIKGGGVERQADDVAVVVSVLVFVFLAIIVVVLASTTHPGLTREDLRKVVQALDDLRVRSEALREAGALASSPDTFA